MRFLRLIALGSTCLSGFTLAQPAPVTTLAKPVIAASSWQHAGSDIPADPAWRTGTLANGLRYAVRRNALPPGSISVRVRLDVGALMETDEQQGWTHMMEHMAFRGTDHYPDGEGVRIWQRLGASFGIDTNAQTSLTATTYMLDLPRADAASLHIAMPVLAEMMKSAHVDAAPLDTERKVVLAEGAMRLPPLARKIQAAARPVMLAGTKAATRDILGTQASLEAATADRLRAFYHHWYRPSRAVVVVVGDADPAVLEAEVKASFGDWKPTGPEPAEPDYGAPRTPPVQAAAVADAQAPSTLQTAWVTPHDETPFTIARQQRQFADIVALGVVNQRLAREARKAQSLVSASAGLDLQRHVEDRVTVGIVPAPGQDRAALDRTFAVLNQARSAPPAPADVDQQVAALRQALARAVPARQTATSASLATAFVNDVDTGDVTPDPQFYLDLFDAQRAALTPAAVGKDIARLLAPEPRLLLLSPTAFAGGDAAAAGWLASARTASAAREEAVRAVSLDELKQPGIPARVTSRSSIADLGIERVRFSNGVTLDYKKTPFEKDRIRVRAVVGNGLLGRAPGDPGLFWSDDALLDAGVGPFTADELTRLVASRQIGSTIGTDTHGVVVASGTSPADLADALRLMAAEVTQMRYAPAPVARLKDQYAATYQTVYSQPTSVLQAFGSAYFYGGDARFRAMPPLADVQALTLPAFERFWQGQLAGPIRIEAVGDIDGAALERAVANSFGRLAARPTAPPAPASLDVRATPPAATPVVLHHRGAADQAAVARVFPTLGALRDVAASRALDVAAALIQTRLTEVFREQQAGTYSPFVSASQSKDLPDYGALIAGAQLGVDRIADFYAALDLIVADLAAHGPDADALARARATAVSGAQRQLSDNRYWMAVLDSPLDDPRNLAAVRTLVSGRQAVDGKAVQAAVSRYLAGPSRGFAVEVRPAGPAG